jgi:hypothetical protein
MPRARLLVLVAAVLALLVVAAYSYGRYASCPPPDWWFRLFLRSGSFACVA